MTYTDPERMSLTQMMRKDREGNSGQRELQGSDEQDS
jgi:hypothetical protein